MAEPAVRIPSKFKPSKTPNIHALHQGTVLHRVHPARYGAAQFNATAAGNARFSPIRNARGNIIPAIYAAQTFAGAAMETAFHDVPLAGVLKTKSKTDLETLASSEIKIQTDLVLADLSVKGLGKLGLEKKDLIETDKDAYAMTRSFAEHLHASHPNIHGLSWVSRKDDTNRAFVLFGDRIRAHAICAVAGSTKGLVSNDDIYEQILELADEIDVKIV